MKFQAINDTDFWEFNGTSELFDAIKDTPVYNRSRVPRNSDFCEYTWDQTLTGLVNGWREGTQEIHHIVSKIHSLEREYLDGHGIEYDVTGDFIDMGVYLTGEPECMGRIIPREIIKDEVHILINTTFSRRVDSRTIKIRGAAITALIEKLMDNYEVKLLFGMGIDRISHYHRNIEVILNIDLQNEFSRDVIAFCAAHPGYFRRCLFALMEKTAKKRDLGNYGYPTFCKISLDNIKKSGAKNYYFGDLKTNPPEWSSPEAALQEVNRIVESLK